MQDGAYEKRGSIRSRLIPALSLRTLDARALAGSLSVLAVLCAYRFYNYWTTGFFVADEYGYFFDAIHGWVYSDRWFVGWVNIALFKALGFWHRHSANRSATLSEKATKALNFDKSRGVLRFELNVNLWQGLRHITWHRETNVPGRMPELRESTVTNDKNRRIFSDAH